MSRTYAQIAADPHPHDIVLVTELVQHDAEPFEHEWMLRVINVTPPHVLYKQYGSGKRLRTLEEWTARLTNAIHGEVFQFDIL